MPKFRVHPKGEPLSKIQRANCALQEGVQMKDICHMCGQVIMMMAFKGTTVCSELCRKDRDDDHSVNHAIIEAPQGGEQ